MDILQTTGGCAVEFLLSTTDEPWTSSGLYHLRFSCQGLNIPVDQRVDRARVNFEDEKFPIFLKGKELLGFFISSAV